MQPPSAKDAKCTKRKKTEKIIHECARMDTNQMSCSTGQASVLLIRVSSCPFVDRALSLMFHGDGSTSILQNEAKVKLGNLAAQQNATGCNK